MGNWCCCFNKPDCDNDETQGILDHPIGINDGDSHYGSTMVNNNHNVNQSYQNQNIPNQINGSNAKQQQTENQQNQLYQNVLDRLTSRVIDIAAIEKSCEQADLTDREQTYRDKLMAIRRHVTLPSNSTTLITGGDYPHKNKDPMPMDDYKLITELALNLNAAILDGFKIQCDEPFVVNFDA
ncbi:uncharacterized protein LOC124491156 isoform X1 [Dermatophagoides farinae]|uniref:Late endosomal/lysosomal adaptor and MAPK and MTOR activator 1 n=1 Tax=Dermatophagoides farinae TaxID=6954 RepID=A0A922I542_DERFA|nr:uncharacterized protein LOC124491156 [Dermatophagoides farinae]KAH7638956.1 hypothetical protein HUG17_2989 [Dermatophagoides farinae]KAH9522682.1 hypothetical protein DERF_006248 [Dermatophagoides farinae]